MLWCSWVKAATDRSDIKEQLNITRTGALHKYLHSSSVLSSHFETRKQQPMLPAEAPGTFGASPDPEESSQHHKSKATRSWVLRENQGNGVRLPLPQQAAEPGLPASCGSFVQTKYGWLMPCGTSQGRQKTAQDLLENYVLLEQMLGARQDVPAYLSLAERSRGNEGGGEESGTWVPSHRPQGAMPPPAIPQSSSSKAVSQLGAPRFWRQPGYSSPWKREESLWFWGSASTRLEQSTHKQLNSRHGFPAFIKRHAANNAAIWQVGRKKKSAYSIRLLFTISSREMRSLHLF